MTTTKTDDDADDLLAVIEQAVDGLPPDRRDEQILDFASRHPAFREHILDHFRLQSLMRPAASATAPTHRFHPGDRVGPFTVVRFVARGGMGEVYEALEEALDRRVALKVIKKDTAHPFAEARFRREERTLAKLHHSHIVPIHQIGEQDGVQFCAMQYVHGASVYGVVAALTRSGFDGTTDPDSGSLRRVVASLVRATAPADASGREETRTWTEPAPCRATTQAAALCPTPEYFESVADVLAQAAEAIHHGHDHRVCHRDIKPSNLMIDTAGMCWVIDYGLARHGTDPAPADDDHTDDAELTRGVLGTPAYMAPEQFDGQAEPASDVWGLGATLYELLTLRRPFPGTTRKELEEAVRTTRPVRPRTWVPSVPRDLEAICLKALAKAPADRYPTAQSFADDLRRWRDWQPTVARPARVFRRAGLWAIRNKGWASAIACVFVTLASGLVVTAGRAEERKRQLVELRQQQDRERAVVESQHIRLGEHFSGWSRQAMKALESANAIRAGDDLRDQVAATFVGLDATLAYSHPIPHPPRPGHRGVGRVVFSPDGVRVLAAGWDEGNDRSPALLWDGNNLHEPTASTRPGAGPVAFPDADSPLQLVLPLGVTGKSLTLWNVGTNTAVLDVPLPEAGFVGVAALSPDARFAAASFVPASKTGKLGVPVTVIWAIDRKAATAKKLADWPGFSTVLAFSPDGQVLASGSNMGEVIVRSTADGKQVLQFAEAALPVTALGFGKNYRRLSGEPPAPVGPATKWLLAVGSKGGDLSVWDLRSAVSNRMSRFYGSEYDIKAVAFSPDGSTLASAGRNYAFLWDVAAGKPLLRTLNATGGLSRTWTEGVAFSPDGRRVAFGSPVIGGIGPGGLDVYRLDEDRGIRTYRGLTGVIEKTWLSPSGKWVAALAQNWQLGVWDRATGAIAFVWDVPAGGTADNSAVAFDENDTQVLFASGVRVSRWKLTNGEQTGSWDMPIGANDSLVTRPGKKPILVRRDWQEPTVIRARELGPNKELIPLCMIPIRDGIVSSTFLSSDGRVLLVNVEKNGTMRPLLFDGLSGNPIPFDQALLPPNSGGGWLSSTGAVMTTAEAVGNERKSHHYRLPDMKRLSSQLGSLDRIDDAGKIGVTHYLFTHSEAGVALHRVGEERPVVTFDVGRPPVGNALELSHDGRFVYWGRRDGTVCVADVNKCVEQLAPFGGR